MKQQDQGPAVQEHSVPPAAEAKSLDADALADFRDFLDKNKDELKTGMGAFHHDGHSNW